MPNMMIYTTTDKVGGNIESVWGHKMRVNTIESSDKEAVEQAKADGWTNKPQDVIEQMDAEKMQAENKAMKGVLVDGQDKDRIDELEDQLVKALTEVAELEQKLAIYEESKDANGDGVVSYDEMTIPELSTLLTQREVEHNKRDGKDALVKLATDSE